jgi:4-amino-4-deoxy-L-arabinose transferase-like glycosyltransferase
MGVDGQQTAARRAPVARADIVPTALAPGRYGGTLSRRVLRFGSALLLLGIAALLLFWNLGATSLHNGDEGVYLQSAREMVESGDYLTLRYNGRPFLIKPPGKIWLIALGYKVLGINEWGGRLSSALFALGTIAMTLALGRAVFGWTVGLLGAAVLLSSTQFLHEHCARTAEQEPETAFFYVLTVFSLWRIPRDARWFCGLVSSLGILVLIKGPIVGPAVIIVLLYALITKAWRAMSLRTGLLGALLFLVIVAPWHVHQIVAHGDDFVREYVNNQMLGRVTGGTDVSLSADGLPAVRTIKTGRAATFYPLVVFYSMFPWSLLIVPGLVSLLWNLVRKPRDRGPWLLLVWTAAYGLTITVIWTKFPWYVVPILPPLALLVAVFCHRLYEAGFCVVCIVAAITLTLSALYVPVPTYDPYSRMSPLWPEFEQNLTPLAGVSSPLSLVPVGVTLGIAVVFIVATVAMRRRVGDRAHTACGVLLASFVFVGLYHAALPLRHAAHRSEIASCFDAVRREGLLPSRVLLLGRRISPLALAPPDFFYIYDLVGGATGEIVAVGRPRRAAADPAMYRAGTLVLLDQNLTSRMPETVGLTRVWRGKWADAFYVRGP